MANSIFFEDGATYYDLITGTSRSSSITRRMLVTRPPTQKGAIASSEAKAPLPGGKKSLIGVGNGPMSVIMDMMRVQDGVSFKLGMEHMLFVVIDKA